MTNVQKNEVTLAVKNEISRIGSAKKVSVKCGVSSATISQMINYNWKLISVEMWHKVASGLHVSFSGWQIAQTTNFNMLYQVFNDAKDEKLFIAVSNRAGSGKSAITKVYSDSYNDRAVFTITAREWARKEFVQNLCQTLGIERPKGLISIDKLSEKIVEFFEERQHLNPLLIIDEADKLKSPAIRFLIPLYNRLEDKMGLVILGTDNLEKEIRAGVRLNRKGFDELDSRFGRRYIKLQGATKKDVVKICQANNIIDPTVQIAIFKEATPISKVIKDVASNTLVNIKVVEDMRRIKRAIKREALNMKAAAIKNELRREAASA
ncbi:MAG: ATP-binding protein [Urechidicola sp.]|nr:ATP-binding protein [Urechidicola sp.]